MSGINDLDPVDQAKVQPLGSRALDWLPTGPVSKAFVMSGKPVTCIMGPYGSGKTTAAFIKGLLCSCVVPRSPKDGVRYARGLVVRDTYRNLELNTIPSWHERFPRDLGTWKGGGGGEPGKAVIDFELTKGEILHLEVIFAALGDHNVKTFCDGFQANWCFANGLDALPPEFLSYMRPRLGRWPPPEHRPADWKAHVHRWRKLFGDMNAPDLDNWTYGSEQKSKPGFVEHVPKNWELFVQPGGTDPGAENLENLEEGYYDNLIAENEDWWVSRFVHNKWGYSRAGTPVYPEWRETMHVAKAPLKYDRARKLILGLDAGRRPAAVAMQKTISGRINVLGELIAPESMGAKKFAGLLSEWLAENFPDADIVAYADPSAVFPTQDTDDEDDGVWIEVIKAIAKIKVRAAPTNALTPRLEAVRDALTELTDGIPNFQLDPVKCPVLRRGFNSAYRFGKVRVHGDEQSTEEPVKTHPHSDVHDALQYAALGSSDYQELRGRGRRSGTTSVETSWDPHG